jgi:hypothetical protein
MLTYQSTRREALVPDDPFNPLLNMIGLGVCLDIVITQPNAQVLYVRLAQAENRSTMLSILPFCH